LADHDPCREGQAPRDPDAYQLADAVNRIDREDETVR
jgi:hypothetical protein